MAPLSLWICFCPTFHTSYHFIKKKQRDAPAAPRSDLLFLSLSLQQSLISIVLESPQFILQLLSFSLRSVQLILQLLPQLLQSAVMLHQQAVPQDFLWMESIAHTWIKASQTYILSQPQKVKYGQTFPPFLR